MCVFFVLTISSSSSASVSPVVLLKLLVLDEEREMFGLPLLHSFSLINGLKSKIEANQDKENAQEIIISNDKFILKIVIISGQRLTFPNWPLKSLEKKCVSPLFVRADLR